MSPPAPKQPGPRHPLDVSRRELLLFGASGSLFSRTATAPLKPIVVTVSVMLDRGAHSAKGLSESEVAKFKQYQEQARREYATSGIRFDLRFVEGAFLRTQGYSEIPEKFLARKTINLFVTDTLGYDIDRDRTGGCSTGPRPRGPRSAPDPFYKTFLGLRDARDITLAHEYAHHFTLDTRRNPSMTGNLWADLRNDYWLWRQRHGLPILQFRACASSEWARIEAG
jgi:hypothetical protein